MQLLSVEGNNTGVKDIVLLRFPYLTNYNAVTISVVCTLYIYRVSLSCP